MLLEGRPEREGFVVLVGGNQGLEVGNWNSPCPALYNWTERTRRGATIKWESAGEGGEHDGWRKRQTTMATWAEKQE